MIREVKHIKKYFGERLILNDINFTVDAGECLGIVGLSGGGKSTLAKIIARLIPSDGGQIFLCGEDKYADDFPDARRLFQPAQDIGSRYRRAD